MPRLIRGVDLSPTQYEQVARAYVHWDSSKYWKTQDKFIKAHAFSFTNDGKRLAGNVHSAKPAYMVNWEEEDRKDRHLK